MIFIEENIGTLGLGHARPLQLKQTNLVLEDNI